MLMAVLCVLRPFGTVLPSAQISKLTRLTIVLAMVIISTFIAVVGENILLSAFKSFILFLLTFSFLGVQLI